jgi:predicted peptidase
MVFSTRAGFSTTIQKVSVDVNSGNIIYLNQNDSRQHTVLNSNIEAIELRLTDQNNNLIDLNDINYELTMGFFVYPINQSIRTRTLNATMRRGININTQQQNNMRPFTPQAQIRPQEEQEFINTEAPIEHKAKRLIIDDIIEQIEN